MIGPYLFSYTDDILSFSQKIFCAEMRSVPPRDLGLGDGHAGQGLGLPLELFHVHDLQQDAHNWGPLWHERQFGVLSAAL